MARIALKRTPAAVVRSGPVDYPGYIPPCQATNLGRPPSGDGWAHEIKHDGFRSQIHVREGEAIVYSKSGYDWTDRYSSVSEHAARLKVEHAIIDGEMVVSRDDGTCDFWALQEHVRGTPSDRLAYHAFDLLFLNGKDLRRLPLAQRKERLRKLLARVPKGRLHYSEHIEGDGATMWAHAHRLNVEGIISKRLDAPYRSGRGADWVKTPCQYQETFVVVGMAYDGQEFDGL